MTHNVIGSSLPDAYILPATAYTNDANLLWYRSCVPLHKGDTIPVINPLTLLRWIDEFVYIIGWIGECKHHDSLIVIQISTLGGCTNFIFAFHDFIVNGSHGVVGL